MNAREQLENYKPEKDFFIGIDSDGCAFDSMEIKHKECFIPNFIKHFGLQPISKYARTAAEFTNLYSKTRGANRFLSYQKALMLLREWPKAMDRGAEVWGVEVIQHFIDSGHTLGNPGLREFVAEQPADGDLVRLLNWSIAVNDTVADLVYNVPPFPGVRESLAKMQANCDVIVVSATPEPALNKEWAEHHIDSFVRFIAGQESGTKVEHLEMATGNAKYEKDHALMMGDAPGDLRAARKAGTLFYPINPGDEDRSWKRFHDEAYDRFINGTYAGEYENSLIEEFESYLPELPPWKEQV